MIVILMIKALPTDVHEHPLPRGEKVAPYSITLSAMTRQIIEAGYQIKLKTMNRELFEYQHVAH